MKSQLVEEHIILDRKSVFKKSEDLKTSVEFREEELLFDSLLQMFQERQLFLMDYVTIARNCTELHGIAR
jgi:transposase